MKLPKKITVFRTDRLGDVVLSLSAVERLKRTFKDSDLHFVVDERFVPFLGTWAGANGIVIDGWSRRAGFEPYLNSCDAAVILFDEPGLAWAAFRRWIPVRIGNRSKLRSWFFLNHSVRQRRSQTDAHESEHSSQLAGLLAAAHGKTLAEQTHITLPLPVLDISLNDRVMIELGGCADRRPTCLVHPGTGGSATNMSPSAYVGLISKLRMTVHVVLSQGPAPNDASTVERILESLPDLAVIRGLSLEEFASVVRLVDVFIAPSTGALHVAHIAGAKTIGIFSGHGSQRPSRWRPLGGVGVSRVVCPDRFFTDIWRGVFRKKVEFTDRQVAQIQERVVELVKELI